MSISRPVLLLVLAFTVVAPAQSSLADYLPEGVEYDQEIPKPADVLGFEVGEWHVRHDKLVEYMRAVAAASERVSVEVIGHTWERRELLLLTISKPERYGVRLEAARDFHLKLCDGGDEEMDVTDMPVVVNLGYSVHGNESSGANAALLVAYHLAAAQGPAIDALLENAIILLDPCLNPDGLSRFAHWANMHKGRNLVGDPSHREHREPWPSGRTNHYWFDLNRDWLLLTHPESQARVKQFHRWRPNVLADFHEMGTNGTYFFQPGVPERKNPLTPQKNVDFTEAIAKFHARALDARGELYFTEESFDDFYYGKGSTSPDIHGGVGILFEQASARGHLQDSVNGPLSFPRTIANQFATSLSTLEGALTHRVELLEYQREFYRTAKFEAAADPVKMYVFPYERKDLEEFLARHDIEVDVVVKSPDDSLPRRDDGGVEELDDDPTPWFGVETAQPQYRLIRSLFECRTEFDSDTFYDVSTWRLPSAFGAECVAVGAGEVEGWRRLTDIVDAVPVQMTAPDAIAWTLDIAEPNSINAVTKLLRAGVVVRFRPDGLGGGECVIHAHGQSLTWKEVARLVHDTASAARVGVVSLDGGLMDDGPDLGSPQVRPLEMPRPLLVVGNGVSTYEAGEVWFVLDERYDIPVSLVERDSLGSVDLDDYTHVIMVSGSYGSLSDGTVEAMKRWVRGGGVVFAQKSAARWAGQTLMGRKPEAAKKKDDAKVERKAYADRSGSRARRRIPGSIFTATLDRTHPLGWGFERDAIHMFKNSTTPLTATKDAFANVVVYDDEPHLSGYAPEEAVKKLAGTSAVIAERMGRGVVVRCADDVCFRGYWRGTERLLINTLLFAGLIENTAGADDDEEDDGAHEDHGHAHGAAKEH